MAITPENNLQPVDRNQSIAFGRRVDWIVSMIILIIGVAFIIMLQSLPGRATIFPWFITISIVFITATYVYGKYRNKAVWDELYDPDTKDGDEMADTGPAFVLAHRRGVLISLGSFLLVVAMTMVLGPEYAVPLFVFGSLLARKENWILSVLSGIGIWVIIHFVFGDMMRINVPVGFLFGGFN